MKIFNDCAVKNCKSGGVFNTHFLHRFKTIFHGFETIAIPKKNN